MFARSVWGNQFQPSAFGTSPVNTGAGFGGSTPFGPQFGGYNPILPYLAQPFNALGAFGGYPPALQQIGNAGFNPYQQAPINTQGQISIAHLLASLTPGINPYVAAQLAAINPAILQGLAPNPWGGQINAQFNPGQLNPLFQSQGYDTNYFGNSPFGNQLGSFGNQLGGNQLGLGYAGQGIAPFNTLLNPSTGGLPLQVPGYGIPSPYTAQDPFTAALLAQQYTQQAQQFNPLAGQQAQQFNPLAQQLNQQPQQFNPQAQQRLPIRSLINTQQIDPYQIGLSGGAASGMNQMSDPYAMWAQAQLMSQQGINPAQTMNRPYNNLAGWSVSPYATGQQSPVGQAPGIPFNV